MIVSHLLRRPTHFLVASSLRLPSFVVCTTTSTSSSSSTTARASLSSFSNTRSSTQSCSSIIDNNIMSTDIVKEAQEFVNTFNKGYEERHINYESQFWGTKMALKDTDDLIYNSENLSKTQSILEEYLSNSTTLQQAENYHTQLLQLEQKPSESNNNNDLMKTLEIIIRTGKCNDMSTSPTSKVLREQALQLEADMTMKRNRMKLGYIDPEDTTTTNKDDTNEIKVKELSSVGLRNLMRISSKEEIRKAAYEGLRTIGPFVCSNGFPELVKLRNQFAKSLGYIDFYDYKVTNAEGFGKLKLFEILDGLEVSTRSLNDKARQELEKRHGKEALQPWNTSYMMSGDVIKKMDPFFPFSKAVERYLRSYAALKIDYAGSTMNLDLLDRQNKYSNGFCHWPKPAWSKPDGSWQPATANFTSLADPSATGSGLTALTTLMHEAGHAAHFANIKQPSPLFSQERAPTSVAYAENQSMFLDSLVGDSAWRAKYALDNDGKPIPFEIIKEQIMATHPFKVFQLRSMLVVSYFEKALYELPEDQVTTETIQQLADDTEKKIQGGPSARPLLSVPHVISDEASCYYHGYTLAEMSVHQTRNFFLKRDGYIVDNPKVGPTLTKSYWECGNSRPFLDIVKDLTGAELSGDAWVAELEESVEDCLAREEKDYKETLEKMASQTTKDEPEIDLNMTVRFVDGDTVISDSTTSGLLGACKEFEDFVTSRMQASAEETKTA